MLEVDYTWTSSGAAGGLDGVAVPAFPPLESVLYCSASTLATTQSFALQTAISSGGPWVTEGSTAVAANGTSASIAALRLTGPYVWVRPVLNSTSTGTYTFRLLGVR